MLIAVINVQFHLFQEAINQFTVVIALDNTNQIILTMTDHQETTEVQDIQETTDHLVLLEILEIMTEKTQL